MCSIVGIGFQRNHTVFNEQVIYQLITKLLLSGMSRGGTATGLCFTSNKEMTIIKDKVNAKEFTDTDFYKKSLEKYVYFGNDQNSNLVSVIGHCRYKTKGTELNSNNNHPIHYGNVVGAHNGIIMNDDALFAKYKEKLSRKAQVDSEIIFALIDHFSKIEESIPKGIQKTLNWLNGDYACSMVHRYQPYILWLFRGGSPCTIYHFKEKGIIIFASLPTFITNAISEFSLGDYDEISLNNHSGIGIDLYRNKYQQFTLNSEFIKSGFIN